MKTAGIIVEYNPFHNGHQLHIERTRQRTGADFIIAVMSGDFVQRGAPAIIDKHIRTRMALLGGADLVLELPVLFATGSAGDFAAGAVSLLDKLGVVDALCFGSESGSIAPFLDAAALLAEEPPAFSSLLREYLKRGVSFPHARSMAFRDYLSSLPHAGSSVPCGPDNRPLHAAPLTDDFFTAPNNILGLEYCTALRRRKSAIQPFTIKREGAGYHDQELFSQSCAPVPASAAAIRRMLLENPPHSVLNSILTAVPARQCFCWQALFSGGQLLFPADFTKELRCRLILEPSGDFTRYADVTRQLSDKLKKNYLSFTDWEHLCGLLKSRELTYSRISRALCHILLSVTNCQLERARAADYVPYARILGFQRSAAPLLSAIGHNSSIPLISKLADAHRLLSADAFSMLQQDIASAHLYESAAAAKAGTRPRNEYTRQICILP